MTIYKNLIIDFYFSKDISVGGDGFSQKINKNFIPMHGFGFKNIS